LKTTLAVALCATFIIFVCAAPMRARAADAPRYRVQIEAPGELKDMLTGGLNLVRWQDDPNVTPSLLERLVEEAKRSTREAVAALGWFSAKVTAQIDRTTQPWNVMLRVEPGPRTMIQRVDIAFTGPVVDDGAAQERIAAVRKAWSLGPGAPFRESAWDKAKQEAASGLSDWRYAAARVSDSQAVIDPDAHTAVLSVTLDSGPPFRFGAIQVSGTKRYDEDIVRHLSPLETGATFDRDQLLKYERQLLEAGYFISAHAAVDPDPAHADAAPVRVAVIEGPSQHLDVGLHFNTDTGFRPELHYKDSDLFNRSWRLRADLDTSIKQQATALNLDLPPRADGRWFNTFTSLQRTDVQNLRTNEFAVGVGLNHGAISSPSGPVVSYHLEDHKVAGAETDYRHAVFFAYRYAFRHTDDFVAPRKGYLGTASVGFAPAGLSTQAFGRVDARASLLQPIGSDDLLLRAELGSVIAPTRAGIPSTFLFRTGGDQTVRGYAFESIGVPEGDAIVGGRYLAVASIEATHWIGANWGMAVFVDAGDAWDDRRRFDPALGYGLGPRFRTPIGPIRADIAYGQRDHQFRLHFSIGYTF
jgi:translocation and assembly module TamA